MHKVILFYKYTRIEDPAELVRAERARTTQLGFKGRMIVAHEGINGTYEGTPENISVYCRELTADPRFSDIHFKVSDGDGKAFQKLSIKVRPEIVSSYLGEKDVHQTEKTGRHLKPDELKSWYEKGEEFTVIDMRNDYEFKSGHFKNSLASGMENFRDLQKITPRFAHLKTKKVLTVCTGGVRCEKASAYLLQQGFQDVYQLDGGIVSYMEKYPHQEFQGALYVFDNRITMDTVSDPHEVIGVCERCSSASESYVNCANNFCHVHFILCGECQKKDSLCNDCTNKGL